LTQAYDSGRVALKMPRSYHAVGNDRILATLTDAAEFCTSSWRVHGGVLLPVSLYITVTNGVDLTGLLGGHKGRLGAWGTEVPQKLKLFL